MKPDFRDYALRALLILAGGIAAFLLTRNGQTAALPALAVGATLGALMMGQFGATEE